ncbi:unnamed protein product [Darwinula stevensoni]|uniref:Uncharacterized protein n=1 Tax=Darwinula stevensoni TaxID=69355 RepID=A0A7R9FNG5_9CRUS|nr:unnamed protein product [Darwinula stevensoni]CAG0896733.1 unnamed protein product [Darwinula stevensoni]
MTDFDQRMDEDLVRGMVEDLIQKVMNQLIETTVEKSIGSQWLRDAKDFVGSTFPNREEAIQAIPPIGDGMQSSLVSFLLEMGKKRGESMFIVYNRNMKQLMKSRFYGGLYEGYELIEPSDHDIIIIDRLRGFFFVKVIYLDEDQQELISDARFQRIQEKYDGAKKDFDSLKALLKEVGMESNQVKKCFSLHFPIVAFPRIRKEERQPYNALILYEEDCQSLEQFESWWKEHIINQKRSKFELNSEAHLTLLAIFGAPHYATQVLDNEKTDCKFLTAREMEILVLEPTKCVIEKASEVQTMKLVKQKARSIITKWFYERQVIEPQCILLLGPSEEVIKELENTMPELIKNSAMAAYRTWTNKSFEERRNMVSSVIQRSLTFMEDEQSDEDGCGTVSSHEDPIDLKKLLMTLVGILLPSFKSSTISVRAPWYIDQWERNRQERDDKIREREDSTGESVSGKKAEENDESLVHGVSSIDQRNRHGRSMDIFLRPKTNKTHGDGNKGRNDDEGADEEMTAGNGSIEMDEPRSQGIPIFEEECRNVSNTDKGAGEPDEENDDEYSHFDALLMRSMDMMKPFISFIEAELKPTLGQDMEQIRFSQWSDEMKLLHLSIEALLDNAHIDITAGRGNRPTEHADKVSEEQSLPHRNVNASMQKLLKSQMEVKVRDTFKEIKKLIAKLTNAVSLKKEKRNKAIRDRAEIRKLHIPKLQKLQEEGKKFDHILVLDLHELSKNCNDVWFQDLRNLHSDHAEGYFWLFTPEDELPGKLSAELNCSHGSKVVTRIDRSKPTKETTWLYQAEQFIKETYRDWETEKTTHLVPYVEDKEEWIRKVEHNAGEKAERSLIITLYQLGKNKRLPMFITYNRNFSHLIKTKDVGGGSEGIMTGEHDVVMIHRELGAVFMQVKNLDTKSSKDKPSNAVKNREGITNKARKNAVKRNIDAAEEQLKKDVKSLKAAIKESGVDGIDVSLCVIALVNVKRAEVERKPIHDIQPPIVFLCEEDLKSVKSIEQWWNDHLLSKLQSSIDTRMYLKLLAIYIAPVYASPAHTARMTTQKINFLTADKLDMLVNKPKDFAVKGAAGTGKTWLLQEKIRNIVMSWFQHQFIEDKDEKILLVCRQKHLYLHFCRTLPDLLLTSAMAMQNRWRHEIQEGNEKQKVMNIIKKNLIICSADYSDIEVWADECGGMEKKGETESLEDLLTRIWNATWEIFLFYRFFCHSVASLPLESGRRWKLKAAIMQRVFRTFTPDINALLFLEETIRLIAFKDVNHPLQLIGEGSVGKSMLGMSHRLTECNVLMKKLPSRKQLAVVACVEKILRIRGPPFHHVFVDEAEDLCLSFQDHWLSSLRSLQKQGGYFWRTYDPLSTTVSKMPDSLKEELECAHSLFTVLRNPGYVFHSWTTNLKPERDYDMQFPGTVDAIEDNSVNYCYSRDEIFSGHDSQGPNVEKFHVSSSILSEKILEILREKFGYGTHPGDIAVLFANKGDFKFHGERLRKAMELELRVSPTTPRLVVEYANFFKGMEAPIVFLITNQKAIKREKVYIGASRSTSRLIQIEMETTEQEDEQANREAEEAYLKCLPANTPEEYKEFYKSTWREITYI